MEIIKVDITEKAKLLFELGNKAFYREFDLPAREVQEEIDYLKGSDVYILYEENIPVGFFAIKKDDDGYDLNTISVLPEKQRKGFGTAMMHKILELTLGHTIHLTTHPKNTGAILYYLKSGFEIYGWKDNCYGDGEPRLLLKHEG
jgi:ribosomal protein S18 acetylase RimI-like enzyme